MTATIKMSSQLPDGDANGLTAIIRALIDEPQDVHVVVALVDCKRTTTDTDTGDVVPTARVRRCEVVGDDEDRTVLRRLVRRAYERRTGKAVLPFELETELRDVFGDDEGTE